MTASIALVVDALRRAVAVTGPDASGVLDVAAQDWRAAVSAARDAGAEWFDLLTAYDELDDGFAVLVRVTRVAGEPVLLRARVPRTEPAIDSVADLYPGAAWHEREVHEMYGVVFTGHDPLRPLLLHAGAPEYPLRKDTPLPARVEQPWPGAADPAGERRPGRRPTLPPGVPAAWLDGDTT